MTWKNELQSAVVDAASNPKIAGTISAVTASLGFASLTDMITGTLALFATVVGIAVTMLLGRVHWANYKAEMLRGQILRKQLIDMGINPDEDE